MPTELDGIELLPNEYLRAIPGYSGYLVSNKGRVFSLKRYPPVELKTRNDGRGYIQVNLMPDGRGKQKTLKVHRLVLFAFFGSPPEDKTEVHHLDGNKANNATSNLAYTSRPENIRASWDDGARGFRRGSDSPNSKYTETQIAVLHRARKPINPTDKKYTLIELQRLTGINQAYISQITKGYIWKHMIGAWQDIAATKEAEIVAAEWGIEF